MKKTNDPAFLLYSSDFLTGTIFMTNEQIGKYIKLLCLQHQKGRLTEKQFYSICDKTDDEVISKFSIAKNGLFFNKRVEEEIEKRNKFSESRRINGSKGGRPKKPSGKPSGKPKHNHTEDENEDENISISNGNIDFEELKIWWNDLPYNLTKVQVISEQRKKSLNARVKDLGGNIEIFKEQIEGAIRESDYLQGKKNDWVCSFDFILQKSSFIKIIEGNYKGSKQNNIKDLMEGKF